MVIYFMRFIWIGFLCLLTGCSGISRKVCNNKNIGVYFVQERPRGYVAYATYQCTQNSTIEIWASTTANLNYLMSHEVVHILARVGNEAHNPDPMCAFNANASIAPSPPCAKDLDLLRSVNGTYRIHIKDASPSLARAAQWASSYWNTYLGRKVLEVD